MPVRMLAFVSAEHTFVIDNQASRVERGREWFMQGPLDDVPNLASP